MAIPTIPEPLAKKLRIAIKKGHKLPPEIIDRDGKRYIRFNTVEVTMPNKWDRRTAIRFLYGDMCVLEMDAPKIYEGDTVTITGIAGFSEILLE